MNWKIIAIIAATAIATAAAVVFLLQKQNSKRKMRFDSAEFDEDDLMDDIVCGEQFSFADDDLDAAEETAQEASEEAPTEEVIDDSMELIFGRQHLYDQGR